MLGWVSVEAEPPQSSREKRRCCFLPVSYLQGSSGTEIPGQDKRPTWVSALILLCLFEVEEGRRTWAAGRECMLYGSAHPSRRCPSQKLCAQRPDMASRIPSFHITHNHEKKNDVFNQQFCRLCSLLAYYWLLYMPIHQQCHILAH